MIPRKIVALLVYSLPIQVVALAVVLSVYGIARGMANSVGAAALWWLSVILMIGTIISLVSLVTCLGLHYLEATMPRLDEDETDRRSEPNK